MTIARSVARSVAQSVARSVASQGGGGAPLLLDSLTAVAAFSVRKLRNGHSGACLRVRRSTDNAEQDIGFAGGVLDTSSLLSFCGAGDGFVTKWYDQSGNDRDAVQATTTAQPRIVASGALDTSGGKPALVFDGNRVLATASTFATDSGLTGNLATSVYCVAKKTTAANGMLFGWGNTLTNLAVWGWYDDNTISQLAFAGGNGWTVSAPSNNVAYLHSFFKDPGAINTTTSIYRNGSLLSGSGSATTPSVASSSLYLGQWADYSTARLVGNMQELIVFGSNNIASRASIESNINGYWGVY